MRDPDKILEARVFSLPPDSTGCTDRWGRLGRAVWCRVLREGLLHGRIHAWRPGLYQPNDRLPDVSGRATTVVTTALGEANVTPSKHDVSRSSWSGTRVS